MLANVEIPRWRWPPSIQNNPCHTLFKFIYNILITKPPPPPPPYVMYDSRIYIHVVLYESLVYSLFLILQIWNVLICKTRIITIMQLISNILLAQTHNYNKWRDTIISWIYIWQQYDINILVMSYDVYDWKFSTTTNVYKL